MKNQSSGGQSITGAAAQQSEGVGAQAILPRSRHTAGGSKGADGSAGAEPSLGQLYPVPKGTAGLAHPCHREEEGGRVLGACLFAVGAPRTWVWSGSPQCGWSLPRTRPPSPSQLRERGWGCRLWRTQETQEQRKGPHRRPLLLPIGDVPLTGRDRGRSPGRVPGGREAGVAGPPPPANHRHQVTEAAELAAQRLSGMPLLPGSAGTVGCVQGIPQVLGTGSILSS